VRWFNFRLPTGHIPRAWLGKEYDSGTIECCGGEEVGCVSNKMKLGLWILLNAMLAPTVWAQGFAVKADQFVSSYATRGEFRGMVLVAREGKVVFQKPYGNAVEAWGIANAPDTKFELASLSKQFTGAAILILSQTGRLNLDDAVTKYFPQAPDSWKQITVKQLITHTSGLPNNDMTDYNKGICVPYTEEELLATFKSRALKFKPGTQWAYTNTEYYLLAFIIQFVSGESYADFLLHNVFLPLGMSASGFASTLAIVPRMAEGYTRDGKSLRHRDYFDRSLEIGAGGIYSTPSDLLRWNEALNGEKLLNHKSLELMFTPSTPGNYGFGWFIEKTLRAKVYHEGSDPGFAAFEIRYPEEKAFIVILSNLEDAPVRVIANGLGGLLLDGKIPDDLK
jgi:CubicO group peptidase (beta-lactamase class C family)